jgi:hypothetical protein
LISALDLWGEVLGFADLADQLQLGRDPVGVLLFTFEDAVEQLTGSVVALGDARCDPAVESIDRALSRWLAGSLRPRRRDNDIPT